MQCSQRIAAANSGFHQAEQALPAFYKEIRCHTDRYNVQARGKFSKSPRQQNKQVEKGSLISRFLPIIRKQVEKQHLYNAGLASLEEL
jgi:hypothetical protein